MLLEDHVNLFPMLTQVCAQVQCSHHYYTFVNTYFSYLKGQTTGWEWNVGFTGFNLNTDMAIYKVDCLKNCLYL